jgi:septation ring formation regulator EzrA
VLQLYKNYKNGLSSLKDSISRLDEEINKGWKDMIDLMSDLSFMNEMISAVGGHDEVLFSNEIDRLTKEEGELLNYINTLKETCQENVCRLGHPPPIPVPPNNVYVMSFEIDNGLLGANRNLLLK